MRKWRTFSLASLVVLLVAIPLVVLAATGGGGGQADRQRFKFRTGAVTTSSTQWKNVPGLTRIICAINEVSVSVSANLSGAPMLLRVVVDSGPKFRPGAAHFNPPVTGVESFSYTFARSVGTFEGSDGHAISVQWRSPSGSSVKMSRGIMNMVFETGTCP